MTAKSQGKAKLPSQPYNLTPNSSVSEHKNTPIPPAATENAWDSATNYARPNINDDLFNVLETMLADGFSSLPNGALRTWLNDYGYDRNHSTMRKDLARELLRQAEGNLDLAINLLVILETYASSYIELVDHVRKLVEGPKQPVPKLAPPKANQLKEKATSNPASSGRDTKDEIHQTVNVTTSVQKKKDKPTQMPSHTWSWATVTLIVSLSLFAFLVVLYWLLS